MRKTDFEFPSLYRRRLAASTDNGPLPQSFTDIPSSTDPSEPEGFISSFRVRSNIRNATVLDLHHIGAVGKFYGPADCRQKRDWPEDQWLTDFRREQRMYETVLRPLCGSVVPRYFGTFDFVDDRSGAGLILLEDAGQRLTGDDDFADVPLAQR
jgi:hypothetical protein